MAYSLVNHREAADLSSPREHRNHSAVDIDSNIQPEVCSISHAHSPAPCGTSFPTGIASFPHGVATSLSSHIDRADMTPAWMTRRSYATVSLSKLSHPVAMPTTASVRGIAGQRRMRMSRTPKSAKRVFMEWKSGSQQNTGGAK
jgi:hypothetical protein